ncbi:ABC transporter ATP-binding protein [Micromonospora sp. AP08]|uniref:ABC transporter ATP-binding protein n=1 Tax=Micromonospora sp. AP08 TaxID=2604467 RepID=UPI0011DC1F2B|nr:ABC transporter ATP-binding protein [Micromonospora sp. AP08]TYB39211.1 ABC transporter ATP-binding protein [Micromonospora sp. AP08]
MLMRLLRIHLPAYRTPIALVLLLQLAQTAATLYLPTLYADIINRGVVPGDTGVIMRTGGVMLGVSALQIVGSLIAVNLGARVAVRVGRDVRASVFDRVLTFSAREMGTFGAPSLITRSTNDVQQVQMLVLMALTLIVVAPITCLGGIVLAARQDVPSSVILLVAVPTLGAAVAAILSRLNPQFRLLQQLTDRITTVLREQINGVRVVRAFVRDDAEQDRYTAVNSDISTVSLRVGRLMALMYPTVLLVMNGSAVAVLWLGAGRVADGSLGVGSLTAFLTYLVQILMAVMSATFMLMMVPRAEVCAERILEVLDTRSHVEPPAAPVTTPPIHADLELRKVEFRYPGAEQPVLSDVDLQARPGRTTAIVGSTGSGKTTLLNLVPRLVDATAGSVRIGGHDVRTLDRAALSTMVGLVPQRPYLFSGTVASNLRYGRPDATDDDLWRALDLAQARDFVARMPGGLDAEIAQGGTNVSGGQRQRLAIARTLVQRPRIYLFDDSFSALDYATDKALRAALSEVTADATVVIVAQRISTIRDADRIVVLDDGRVVGAGSHRELMRTCSTYREIVLSQQTEMEAA